jgi:hypothetical protein
MVNGTAFEVTPPDNTVIWTVPTAPIKLASTGAVNWLALMTLVASAVWFHCTTASEPNPLPFTVNVNAGPPAVAALGLMLAMAGAGTTVKGKAFEVAGPDETVIWAVPAFAMSLAGTVAVSWVALPNLVESAVVFQFTTELDENPVPFTVNVKLGPPAVVALGVIALMTGGAVTVNVTAFDPTPPDTTVTWAVPALAMRFAGTEAVNRLLLTNVVVSWVPFHCTAAADWNPLPFTVSVNAGPPAVAVVGEILLMFGPLAIVKVTTFVVKVFDTTVTWAVPGVAIRSASTGAVTWVELTTLVARAVPFHRTTEPVVKPAPFTVSVNAGPPAVALLGLRELMLGVTLKLTKAEVTPPDATDTWAVPAKRSRFPGTAAVNWFALTTVVGSGVPFHCAVASEAKPLPFTVKVNAPLPAAALFGLMLLMAGGANTVKGTAFDVTPVVTTVICAVPGIESRLAGTAAVNCVADTKVVLSDEVFHCTAEAAPKLVPLTVRVKPDAVAVALVGEMLVIVGVGGGAGLIVPEYDCWAVCGSSELSATCTV